MLEYMNYQEMKAFLTVSETARLLCVNYSTVLRMIHSGRLPAVMIRNRYKIKAGDLKDYIQKC
ncbi:MAG: excisionase family DNA-binding protein [Oscillospiraceae bacterium]|nr:excisionase family DNA-binding protein [Oscillospiraceae bacterium]